MDEVDIVKTVSVLNILKRFVDPSDFIPASQSVIFHGDYILVTAVWGGCIYYGGDSFLKPEKSTGIDTMVIPDLSVFLQSRREGTMKIEDDDSMIYFSVGKSQVKFGIKEVPIPWNVTELLDTKPIKIADTFLPALKELAFSISDNAYKSQFGGIWYSESDKKIYASDNNRITSLPLNKPLGTGDHFFVPAVFLKKVPSITDQLEGIAINGGLCLFSYLGFTPFFLIRDVKMPPFKSAFDKARESALNSNLFFKLNLEDGKRDEILGRKSLFYDEKGEASDVHLTSEGDSLKIDILHKQTLTSRGFIDYLTLGEHVGEADIRMDAEFFLDAIKRFDTFNLDTGKTVFAHADETPMEQLIAWKG